MERVDQPIDLGRPVEGGPAPGAGKVSPFGKSAACVSQPIDWAVRVAAAGKRGRARATERAPETLWRILQRFLEPGVKRPPIQAVGLRLGQDSEERIDVPFDGALPQQIRAEPVDRIDVRFLESLERELESCPNLVVRRFGALFFE